MISLVFPRFEQPFTPLSLAGNCRRPPGLVRILLTWKACPYPAAITQPARQPAPTARRQASFRDESVDSTKAIIDNLTTAVLLLGTDLRLCWP